MNVPDLNYNPKDKNRLSSTVGSLFTDVNEGASKKQVPKVYPHNQQFGKTAGPKAFEFVPAEQVKKLQARVYACRQVTMAR